MPDFKTNVDWKSKLTSRKFWVAVANFVTMLIVAFKGTEETATQVAALIMAGASVVAYIIGEGLADAASAGADLPPMLVGTANWDPKDFTTEEVSEDVEEV